MKNKKNEAIKLTNPKYFQSPIFGTISFANIKYIAKPIALPIAKINPSVEILEEFNEDKNKDILAIKIKMNETTCRLNKPVLYVI